MARRQWEEGHPLIPILITISSITLFLHSFALSSATNNEQKEIVTAFSLFDQFNGNQRHLDNNEEEYYFDDEESDSLVFSSVISYRDEAHNETSESENESEPVEQLPNIDELPTNVPTKMCPGHSSPIAGGEEEADLQKVHVQPPCDLSQEGYCGLKRKLNYTLMIKFVPKFPAKTMFVRVTVKDPLYGWETLIWPEFSTCNRFNVTCPQNSTEPVRAFLYEQLPSQVPPLKGLVRVRLFGYGEDNIKRLVVCREFKARVY